MTSRNRSVVTNAVRAPRRSRSALVATVEPWAKLATAPRADRTTSSADTTPRAWFFGVVGTLAVISLPSTSATRSVKVPPTSTPSLASVIAAPLARVGVCPFDPRCRASARPQDRLGSGMPGPADRLEPLAAAVGHDPALADQLDQVGPDRQLGRRMQGRVDLDVDPGHDLGRGAVAGGQGAQHLGLAVKAVGQVALDPGHGVGHQ